MQKEKKVKSPNLYAIEDLSDLQNDENSHNTIPCPAL